MRRNTSIGNTDQGVFKAFVVATNWLALLGVILMRPQHPGFADLISNRKALQVFPIRGKICIPTNMSPFLSFQSDFNNDDDYDYLC